MEVEGAPEAGRVIESRAIPEVDEAGKDLGRVAYYHTNHFEVVLHPAGVTQPAVTEIIVHVYLGPEVDVTPEEIEQVKQYASQSVEHFFTAPRHRLPDGSVLKVDLRFGTGPPGISTPVRLRTGPGRMSAGEWYVNARFSAFAHEVGHLIGLLDEYFDPERRTPGRETEESPGVFDDKSLMAGDTLETELKPRHLEQIWALIQTTRRAIPPESLEEGLTRYRFDPLSNRRQTLLTADSRLERLLMEPHPSDVREMSKLIGSLEQAVADVQGWLDRNRPEPSDELAARARGHLDRAHRLLLDLERARRRSGLPPRGGVEADRPAIPPNLGSGVPAEAIEFIATHTSAFLAAGGAVEVIEPGTSREPWARQAEELAANAEGGDRVAAGRRLLARALRQPYVVVARRGDALMAAIGFDVDPAGSLDVRSAGSAEAGTGAGTAAHFELARYAARRGLRVEDGYTRDARAYHAALGRQLDEEFQGDSVWSVSDVEQIAREVTARVGPAEASQPGPPSHPAAGLMEGMDAARRAVDELQRAMTWGLEPGEVERRRAAAEAALEALARAEAAPGPRPAALEEFLRARPPARLRAGPDHGGAGLRAGGGGGAPGVGGGRSRAPLPRARPLPGAGPAAAGGARLRHRQPRPDGGEPRHPPRRAARRHRPRGRLPGPGRGAAPRLRLRGRAAALAAGSGPGGVGGGAGPGPGRGLPDAAGDGAGARGGGGGTGPPAGDPGAGPDRGRGLAGGDPGLPGPGPPAAELNPSSARSARSHRPISSSRRAIPLLTSPSSRGRHGPPGSLHPSRTPLYDCPHGRAGHGQGRWRLPPVPLGLGCRMDDTPGCSSPGTVRGRPYPMAAAEPVRRQTPDRTPSCTRVTSQAGELSPNPGRGLRRRWM